MSNLKIIQASSYSDSIKKTHDQTFEKANKIVKKHESNGSTIDNVLVLITTSVDGGTCQEYVISGDNISCGCLNWYIDQFKLFLLEGYVDDENIEP